MNRRNQTATTEAPGPGQAVCASSPAVIPWSPTWVEVNLLPDFTSPPSHSNEKTPKSHWLSFPDSSLTFIYLFFTQFTISLCAVSFGHPRVLRVMPHLPYTGSDSREVDRERKTKMEGVCPSNQVVFFKKLTKQNAGQCIYFINYCPKNSILKKGCYCQYYPHLIFIIIPTFEQVSSNTKQWKWVQIESSQFASHCLL